MRFRGKSIRRKIVALLLVPLVSLTAMWAFATYITGREADQLLDVANVVNRLGYPAEEAVQALQKERRQSLLYLADRRGADALDSLRKRAQATDRAVDRLRTNAQDPDVREDLNGEAGVRIRTVLQGADGLSALRTRIEHNTITRGEVFEAYNALVDPHYQFLASLYGLENVAMDKQGRALINVTRAREALAREDALLAAGLAAGGMDKADVRRFSDRVAERRVLYDTALPVLPASERAIFQDYWRTAGARELVSYEDQVIAAGSPRAVDAERWNAASTKVLGDLERMGREAGERFKERVAPVARSVLLKAAGAGVLGFLTLLVSVAISLRIGRRLVKDLTRLRKSALEVSAVRLPSVMRRLAAGEQVDVETEAPRLEFGPDEMGQVGQALNTLQRAAVEAAVKQAEMRHGVSEVFVNLARRSQVLLHRQLTLLDAMERRTEDTDELADLFRLDHLTTRMRRHAEGLVILSGAAPSRQWRKPVQLMDVVRAAVAEVEDYERIEVRRLPRLAVDGPAVSDLTHLIAELLENATVFSPPHTAVHVVGERVSNGFTLEIHDRGLGMSPDDMLDANLRLAETPEFELSDTDRLGLFVVSRLARRQHVRVSLQPSPYGGTTAVVFVPGTILTDAPERDGKDTDGAGIPLTAKLGALPPERAAGAGAVLDGPVELEAPLVADEPGGWGGPRPGRRPHGGTSWGEERRFTGGEHDRFPVGEHDRGPVRGPVPVPSALEQHQPAPDQVPDAPARLPRRRRPADHAGDHGHPAEHTPPHAAPAPTTPGGLPRRVRQASLAPQLKAEPAWRAEAEQPGGVTEVDDRDAEEVRARMASLQRGWQRGRRENGEDGPRAARGTSVQADPREAPASYDAPETYGTPGTHVPPDARGTRDHQGNTAPGNTSGGDGR
ncbi:nitrate- and nitrite sensing domain-containing protein [Streptomyces sp. NPDC003077]|uniref:nitrate- and nitrite sensing domain-containing protein n=1 Tax=Streptomyces sp. NPDC003077 TaxID=3154443 RepID=UPI00339DAB7A